MKEYSIRIEVQESEVRDILKRLTAAQEEIYKCYRELEEIGVVVIRESEKV